MEWTVVLVIIALVGLGAAVVRPIVSLTNSITKLEGAVDRLDEKVGQLTDKNKEAHERLFYVQSEHDSRLDDHEKRISIIEQS